MFKQIIFASWCFIVNSSTFAVPITINQTFHNASYDDYNISSGIGFGLQPSADWIFSGTVDSGAADIDPSPSASFLLTSLTLTQTDLGLINVRIVNAPVLFFYSDRFGFAVDIAGRAPWTVTVYEANHFSGASSLVEYLNLLNPPPANDYTGFGPQWDGFILEDGRRLYGWGYAPRAASVTVTAVAEPSGIAYLVLMAAFLINFLARHR